MSNPGDGYYLILFREVSATQPQIWRAERAGGPWKTLGSARMAAESHIIKPSERASMNANGSLGRDCRPHAIIWLSAADARTYRDHWDARARTGDGGETQYVAKEAKDGAE